MGLSRLGRCRHEQYLLGRGALQMCFKHISGDTLSPRGATVHSDNCFVLQFAPENDLFSEIRRESMFSAKLVILL